MAATSSLDLEAAARDGALKTGMIERWSQGHDRLDELLATKAS